MKVNNIQNYNLGYSAARNNSTPSNKQGTPAFKGALSINFWDAIARGGFAASFTIQDMTGTNLPRTYQALQRNKEITGKNNYKAASEVAIREFLTGPSMCVIPMIVLGISKKLAGSANEVPLNNISAFSDQMKTVLENSPIKRTDLKYTKNMPNQYAQQVKSDFYGRMFALSLGEDLSSGQKISKTAKQLGKMLEEYDNAPKRSFMHQLLNKDLTEKVLDGSKRFKGQKIQAKDQIFNNIVNKYADAKKLSTGDYSKLLTTDMGGILDKPNKISSLFKDFSNFGCDVQKTILKNATKNGSLSATGLNFESFMKDFKNVKVGSKFITNVLMVLLTALFMVKIPKLYTIHKTNPETDAFRGNEGEVVRANK